MNRATKIILAVVAVGAVAGIIFAAYAGAGNGDNAPSGPDATPPSVTSTAVPTAAPTDGSSPEPTDASALGQCTNESILPMLPDGSQIDSFECALGSPYMWAAVEATSPTQVYFMRSNGPWELVDTATACAKGDDQAPEELLAHCPKS